MRSSAPTLDQGSAVAVMKDLQIYLTIGGFPEAQEADVRDRMELLRGYVDATLLRDVIERHAVSHPVALRHMTRHLLGNAAGSSVSSLLQLPQVQASPLQGHAPRLSRASGRCLSRSQRLACDRFRTSADEQPAQGLSGRSRADPDIRPQRSAAARQGAGNRDCHRAVAPRADVGYIRTKESFEVDFLARYPEGREELIQVCADLDDEATGRGRSGPSVPRQGEPRARLLLISLRAPPPARSRRRSNSRTPQRGFSGRPYRGFSPQPIAQ